MSRVLVTGAAGFIGSHVVQALLTRGHAVRGLIAPAENQRNLAGLDVERVTGDLRDADAVHRAVKGCDAVFHVAAIYALWTREPGLITAVNVGGTRNVLEAALAEDVGRVVVTTSQGVWAGLRGVRITEQVEPNQNGCLDAIGEEYCLSKLAQHRLVEEYAARGLDVLSVAPTMPFGPGDLRPTPTGSILTAIVNLPVFTYIESIVNVIDVRDVALGHVLAWERGQAGRAYLLGALESIGMRELVSEVGRQAGIDRLALRVPYSLARASAQLLLFIAKYVTRRPPPIAPAALEVARIGMDVDCSRAAGELGLKVRPYADSIRDALEWFAANGYLRNHDLRRLRSVAS